MSGQNINATVMKISSSDVKRSGKRRAEATGVQNWVLSAGGQFCSQTKI